MCRYCAESWPIPPRKRRARRGFGRIRQERSGRYSAAYVGPDGKLHLAPRTYHLETDAEAWLAAERRKIDLGTWGAVERSDGVTLRDYADQWIEQRQLRPRTRQHYESMLERLILPEDAALYIERARREPRVAP